MTYNDSLQKEVVGVISLYLGEHTANLYNNFYDKEEPQTIVLSATELLSEMLGGQKARTVMQPIVQKFQLKL